MKLFKYSKINEYLKQNLIYSQLWFSPPANFNDINEAFLPENWELTDDDFENEISFSRDLLRSIPFPFNDTSRLEKLRADKEFFKKEMLSTIEWRRNTIGISCFSKDNKNGPLWAHYADESKGICFEVETKFDEDCFVKLETVQYMDTLPTKLLVHLKENVRTFFITKEKQWAYEQEVRAFQHRYGVKKMNPKCLRNLFFGYKCNPKEMTEILSIVKNSYPHKVGFYKEILNNNRDLEFEEIRS